MDDGDKSSGEEWDAQEETPAATEKTKLAKKTKRKKKKTKSNENEDYENENEDDHEKMQIEQEEENEPTVKKSKKKKKKQKTENFVDDDTNAHEASNESKVDNVEDSEPTEEKMEEEEGGKEEALKDDEEDDMKTTKKKKKRKKGNKEPASIIQQIKNNAKESSDQVDTTTLTAGIVRNNSKKQSKEKNITAESDGMRFLRTDADAITINAGVKSVDDEVTADLDGDDVGSDDDGDVINTKQRMNIRDAFANDDVIEDFIVEKEAEVEKSKPKEVDAVLPGWGDWGGAGLKVSARKRKRFTFVPPVPQKKRLDAGKPNVIISEVRNKHIAKHQVGLYYLYFCDPFSLNY